MPQRTIISTVAEVQQEHVNKENILEVPDQPKKMERMQTCGVRTRGGLARKGA